MRYAVFADIHANLEALNAVLADIDRRGGVFGYWILGDITGYGPDPHRCIEIARSLPGLCVAGNHDIAAVSREAGFNFNPDAAAAVNWTKRHLDAADVEYLSSLPLSIEHSGFLLTHGSPRDPAREYVVSLPVASANFGYFNTPHALVGHTHEPAVFKKAEDNRVLFLPFREVVGLVLGSGRFIINPGSVGQPRDGDPRASYAIFDTESSVIRLYRVGYDIHATQEKMLSQDLPVRLAARLEKGR